MSLKTKTKNCSYYCNTNLIFIFFDRQIVQEIFALQPDCAFSNQ